MKIFRRGLNYRIVAEPWSPSPGTTLYLLEVQNSLFGLKYWWTILCSDNIEDAQHEYKKRKNGII